MLFAISSPTLPLACKSICINYVSIVVTRVILYHLTHTSPVLHSVASICTAYSPPSNLPRSFTPLEHPVESHPPLCVLSSRVLLLASTAWAVVGNDDKIISARDRLVDTLPGAQSVKAATLSPLLPQKPSVSSEILLVSAHIQNLRTHRNNLGHANFHISIASTHLVDERTEGSKTSGRIDTS